MRKFARLIILFFVAVVSFTMATYCLAQGATDPLVAKPFAVLIKDAETGRPVPLVELRTVHGVKIFTDNAGIATFDEPGFAGRKIYFHLASPGYSIAADGFDFRGKRLPVEPGTVVEIGMGRDQLAERIFRITGAGKFYHSVRVGREAPGWGKDLNADVLGQDSAHMALFGGKMFWIWGDTNRSGYPLGIFDTTAATSVIPAPDPEENGVALTYFRDENGDARAVARMPGEGPTWLGGLVTLKDKKGKEHLVASYVKVRGFIDVYQRGLCEWDAEKDAFVHLHTFPDGTLASEFFPSGHPVRHRVGDTDYVYFGGRFPTMRIPDSYEAWRDPDGYEAVRCDVALTEIKTGAAVDPHHVSMVWNAFRKSYVSVFACQPKAMGPVSETWYAEAPAPEGPWRKTVQVATHEPYSFYNPLQHPEYGREGGKVIYFEGTYTTLFAKGEEPTPRYDYNQILYRLDVTKVGEMLDKKK